MSDSSTSVGPGTVLADRYELIEEIGRGGFGMVYKGRQLNMDRDVAVKVLPPNFMMIPDVVERFKREARLASRLRHPNTITLHDYGKHENILYIVMELLTGEDLADVLKRDGKLPMKRAVRIARQVLKSLSEAHDEGIVHRDLKPENIFLSKVGEDTDVVKVLDFGIAKLAIPSASDAFDEKNRALTISGSTVGTPTYMSPEQAAGEEVTGQSDLYTLGVILYEMLNGRPPFHNRDPVKVMRSHLFDEPPPMKVSELQGSVVDRVIRKALAKDLPDRFLTANEFLLALAAEPVAKPVVKGVELKKLEEISNDSDDESIHMETLKFAEAQPRADVIPFTLSPKKTPLPPPALGQQDTSASSIIRVIEPAASDDVIVLTAKKSEPVADVVPLTSKDSHDRIGRVDTSLGLINAQSTPHKSESIDKKEEWEWGETVPTGDFQAVTNSHAAIKRPPLWPLLVTGVFLLVLAFLFVPVLRSLLPF